ncbi:MAG: glycine oxidase ThiO [Polyangiaceae bacterium]
MTTPDPPIADALVIGAGVMGCASALALAREGLRVEVLERSVPGAEASSAAAGMLAAQVEAHAVGPFLALSIESRARFPALAEELRALTGIDVEHRACGSLKLAFDEAAEAELVATRDAHAAIGLEAEIVGRAALSALEPAIGERARAGISFPGDARIDPPLYLRALRIAAEKKGARFRSGGVVRGVALSEGRAVGVELADGSILRGRHVVLAAGSWSNLVTGTGIPARTIRPARGQIIELRVPAPLFRRLIVGPRAYLSPRDDGRVLVGSTLEFVGYEKRVTAGAVAALLAGAIELVPALADAELGSAWSNFRPFTDDELPLIGEGAFPGLVLATGHYRNGILLSPITAEIVKDLVLGRRPSVDVSPFAATRSVH